MEGKRLIQGLRLKNFLSYGSEGEAILLEPLNVLIGPNASGKSNLIEAINLLKRIPVPGGLPAAIRQGGGISEFLWKGSEDDPIAEIEATVYYPERNLPLRYKFCFTRVNQRLEITEEIIEDALADTERSNSDHFYYRYQNGKAVLNFITEAGEREERVLRGGDLNSENSILSQRKDPDIYPEITYIGSEFDKIDLYKEWIFKDGRPPRVPLQTDVQGDFLEKGGGNLALVLNNLKRPARQLILENLKKFYEAFEDFETKIQGGTV